MIRYVGKCILIERKEERVLVAGDLHLGYEEGLNKVGILISRKMFEEIIEDFDRIFKKVGKVDKVVLLGDIKDYFGRILNQEWKDVIELFRYLKKKCKEVIVIKGNHDVLLGPIAKKENIEVVDYLIWGEFCFVHGNRDFPEIHEKRVKVWVMGHAHPAVKLSDGVKAEKYKCFLEGRFKGKKIIILPSFFPLVEGSDPREIYTGLAWNFKIEKFKVRAVGESLEVLDFGELRKIK